MIEFLDGMWTKPPASDYQSNRKYAIGPTGGVSSEEVEERGESYGYRVGEGKDDRTDGRRKNGGESSSSNLPDVKGLDAQYRVG